MPWAANLSNGVTCKFPYMCSLYYITFLQLPAGLVDYDFEMKYWTWISVEYLHQIQWHFRNLVSSKSWLCQNWIDYTWKLFLDFTHFTMFSQTSIRRKNKFCRRKRKIEWRALEKWPATISTGEKGPKKWSLKTLTYHIIYSTLDSISQKAQ